MRRLLIGALLVVCACRGRDDLDGERRPIRGLTQRGDELALSTGDGRVVLDLLDNRAAAVSHAGGALVVECGTADMAKYIDGGYRSAWPLASDARDHRAVLVDGLAGELYVPVDGDPGGIARSADGSVTLSLLARAVKPRQLASVFVNEKRLGDISMPSTDWKTYTVRVPAGALVAGENKVRLYFRHTGEVSGVRTAAAIARIALGARVDLAAPVTRTESVLRGTGRLDALRVSGPSRLSYYVHVPGHDPALVLAVGGKGASVSVHLALEGSDAAPVWSGTATPTWTQARVDLSDAAGRVARIDLVSDGPVDWGRPHIVLSQRGAANVTGIRPGVADHVIVWVISSLRQDRAAGDPPTPGLTRLADRGVRFTSAHSASPSPGPAHVALLSGRHPRGGTLTDVPSLGQRFSEAGYTTALISGNGFVNDEAGFARGFATYRNPMRRRHPFAARILWQKARQVLRKHRRERTFLYLATVEPHLPYTPSEDSLRAEWDGPAMRFTPAETIAISERVASGAGQLNKDERAYITALYNAEVRDADAALADMLDDLDELGVAERTAVIVVADHGEELWERGGLGHGRHLFQEALHVPLVIAGPGVTAGQVIERDVSLVDLYATALDMVGIASGTRSQGVSVFAPTERALPPPVFAHLPRVGRSLKLARYKIIVPQRGAIEVYDLATDPDERVNLAGKRPIVERYLRTVFGLGVAYERAWSHQRWGRANDLLPAFAADHGL